MTKTAVVAQKVHAQLLSIISAAGMLRLGGLVEYERLAVVLCKVLCKIDCDPQPLL
jgi:hypothetical protein